VAPQSAQHDRPPGRVQSGCPAGGTAPARTSSLPALAETRCRAWRGHGRVSGRGCGPDLSSRRSLASLAGICGEGGVSDECALIIAGSVLPIAAVAAVSSTAMIHSVRSVLACVAALCHRSCRSWSMAIFSWTACVRSSSLVRWASAPTGVKPAARNARTLAALAGAICAHSGARPDASANGQHAAGREEGPSWS